MDDVGVHFSEYERSVVLHFQVSLLDGSHGTRPAAILACSARYILSMTSLKTIRYVRRKETSLSCFKEYLLALIIGLIKTSTSCWSEYVEPARASSNHMNSVCDERYLTISKLPNPNRNFSRCRKEEVTTGAAYPHFAPEGWGPEPASRRFLWANHPVSSRIRPNSGSS